MMNLFCHRKDRIIYIVILIFAIVIIGLNITRKILSYGAESDYLGTYLPEAKRFLSGEPLALEYHPPFYPIVLALIYLIFKNWIIAGFFLSLISACMVLVFSYHFVKLAFGEIEAVGAIFALFISWGFISFSVQASSDMFFLALFYISLGLIALGEKKQKVSFWLTGGLFIGLAFLSRTSGLPMIFFFLFAVTSRGQLIPKKKIVIYMTSGFLIPIFLWLAIAKISHSSFYVTSNYRNLAVNYFSESNDRLSAEAMLEASEEFSNIWQILKKDPKHIFIQYFKDLFRNTKILFTNDALLPFPYIVCTLIGLILLFFSKIDPFKFIFLINLLAMYLFLNLHPWDTRFYLFIVPIMGAGIMALGKHLINALNIKMKPLFLTIIVLATVPIFISKAMQGYNILFKRELALDSFSASILINSLRNTEEKIAIARKPHLSFYSDSKAIGFPDVKTLEELKELIKKLLGPLRAEKTTVFLFYGYMERNLRPQLAELANLSFSATWLKNVGWGREKGGWVLYQVLTDKI